MKTLLLTLALVATSAHANFWTGNDLHNWITGNATTQQMALGFISGAADATIGQRHCMPANVTLGQVRDMVARTLATVPEHRHTVTASEYVILTLEAYWPCAKGTGI